MLTFYNASYIMATKLRCVVNQNRGDCMFENLRNELSKKRISNKAVADLIGCTQKTLDNKMNGVTEFTLSEILLISDNLLPEFELRYLFKRSTVAKAV